jgi:GNAT superfamily N-acetyltransferase
MTPLIRPYQPTDRPEVERICIATGLRCTLDFVDPSLFARLWLNPYLGAEPEHTWVAETGGRVVGYLVSSMRDAFARQALASNVTPLLRLGAGWLGGRYRCHAGSNRFVRWLVTRSWREQPRHPAGFAHLHFNLSADYRGGDLGRRLLQTFEQRARGLGLPGYYGILFLSRRRPARLYESQGYRLYDQRPCSLFNDEPVQMACIVKEW